MLGPSSDSARPGAVWFSFEGPTSGGVPTAWRAELLTLLRAFPACDHPDDVVLAAGELVSNGVEHGGGVRRLHVDGRHGVVRVEVDDFGSSLTERGGAGGDDRGRGLRIVEAVAERWGWWPTESGKTVWATFGPDREDTT